MKGLPKNYNTKQDVLTALELFPVEAKEQLRSIWANRFCPKPCGENAEGAFEAQIDKNTSCWFRMELDENNYLYRLGFTLKELKRLGIAD